VTPAKAVVESYGSEVAQALVGALAEELRGRYDGQDGSGSEPPASDFDPPNGTFLILYEGDRPVACGGVSHYEETTAEIRRMYVVPSDRGRGLSRRVLSDLESAAVQLGYSAIRLETGRRQPEAIRLYESSGYEPIDRFGPYVDDPRSVCFEKRVSV
jgi:GNAT superfamily N-acetyltransferase